MYKSVIRRILIISAVMVLMMAEGVFAAGSYKVSGKFDKAGELGGEVTYTIYKVGHLSGGGFQLDPNYSTVGARVNYTKADFGEEDKADDEADEWREAWLSSAETLRNYVTDEDKKGECKSTSGDFEFTGLENGLYLITGTSQEEKKDGKVTFWAPRPMYVAVVNGNSTVSLKPASEYADRFIITKAWENDEDVKDMIRPESVDVEIYYDGKEPENLREKVTLSDKNEWTHAWSVKKDEADPTKWFVVEVLSDKDKVNYSVNYTYGDHKVAEDGIKTTTITITNKYDRDTLQIVKTMKDYVSSSGSQAQALVFEITGYIGEAQALHRYAGISYGPGSGAVQTALVSDIPRGIDKIKVTEVYSGNYSPVGPATKEAVLTRTEDGKGTWEVDFENRYDYTTFGSGIINKYSIFNGAFKFDKAI